MLNITCTAYVPCTLHLCTYTCPPLPQASTWFDEDAQPPDTVRESGTTAGAHQRTEAHTGAQEKSEDTDLAGPSVLSLPGAFEQGDEAAHTHMITTQLLHALQNDVAGHLGLSEADGCTEGTQCCMHGHAEVYS